MEGGKIRRLCGLARFSLFSGLPSVESIARGEGGIRDDYSRRFEACRVESTNGRIVKWASWKRPAQVTPPSSAYQARTEGERIDGAALQSHLSL